MLRLTTVFIVSLWVLCYAFIPTPVVAQLTINEFLPNPSGDEKTDEWIELYNNSDQPIDITGFQLRDSVESHLFSVTADHLPNSSIIDPQSYLLIFPQDTNKFSLNNSSQEEIYLYNNSTTSAQLLDHISYNGSSEDKTWGRIPDGVGDLVANLKPTPGQANLPPPTPTPTATPKPTPTPKPTSTPKLTPVPTITITNSNSSTPSTPTPTHTKISATPTHSDTISTISSPLVLGTATKPASSNPTPQDTQANTSSHLNPQLASNHRYFLFIIAAGICFVITAFFPMIKKHLLTKLPFLKLA